MSVGNIIKIKIMHKGLKILAQHNTNRRAIIFLNPNENNLPEIADKMFGEDWTVVGEFCLGDTIVFTSDDIYLGFDNREDDNYCQGALIKK